MFRKSTALKSTDRWMTASVTFLYKEVIPLVPFLPSCFLPSRSRASRAGFFPLPLPFDAFPRRLVSESLKKASVIHIVFKLKRYCLSICGNGMKKRTYSKHAQKDKIYSAYPRLYSQPIVERPLPWLTFVHKWFHQFLSDKIVLSLVSAGLEKASVVSVFSLKRYCLWIFGYAKKRTYSKG